MKFIFDPSLVLYLPLHELDGASFMSKDAHGHLCTVAGALWRPDGRYFDGLDDGINCGSGNILDITEELTIELWVKLQALPAGGSTNHWIAGIPNQYMIYQKDGGTGGGDRIYHDFYGTVTRYQADTGSRVSGDWQHLALRYSKSDGALRFFEYGIEVYSTAVDESLVTTANNLYIGGESGAARTVDGLMGEVRIYNRARALVEIQSNYLATKWRYQ